MTFFLNWSNFENSVDYVTFKHSSGLASVKGKDLLVMVRLGSKGFAANEIFSSFGVKSCLVGRDSYLF